MIGNKIQRILFPIVVLRIENALHFLPCKQLIVYITVRKANRLYKNCENVYRKTLFFYSTSQSFYLFRKQSFLNK